jgi:hypothetical protein
MYKALKDYSNSELIYLLERNEEVTLLDLGEICSEILRRLNRQKPFFDDSDNPNEMEDWANPLTP